MTTLPPSPDVETELERVDDGPLEEGLTLRGRVCLVVRQADEARVIDVDEGAVLTIGRSAEATIQVDDSRASRLHASVRRSGDMLLVTDLGSRNGTRVNSALLRSAERAVYGGDVLRIGPLEIIVAASAPPAPRGVGFSSRIERVLALGSPGAATLIRIAVDPEDGARGLESMADALAPFAMIEHLGDGEYLALMDDDARSGEVLADLRRRGPRAIVTSARFPADGKTFAEIVGRLRALANDEGGLADDLPTEGVVVADAETVKLFQMARRVARAPTTVLVVGETGVGKEVVAEQIHRWSDRAAAPFVRLNCAALPETLLESELFGHERGAFTGADRRKAGYLEAAAGGTLLLDEIGELPLGVQVKLLRVLETRRVMRLGGTQDDAIDVRFVCATHRDLQMEVDAGRFREDLYYRVGVFTLKVPPLRARPAEIALLADRFTRHFAERMGLPKPTIDKSAMTRLYEHGWPGNVRELRNAMEHAVVMAGTDAIRLEHLPEAVRKSASARSSVRPGAMRERVAETERKTIEDALAASGGNQTHAAVRLGISRRALVYKLAKYAIRR